MARRIAPCDRIGAMPSDAQGDGTQTMAQLDPTIPTSAMASPAAPSPEAAGPGAAGPAAPVDVSDTAARRIAWVLAQDEYKGRMLRISVSGGGCSGFQYGFTFDEDRTDADLVIERDGARILIDDVSLDLLRGSVIDYVEDMIGSSFAIRNPQAKSACGCGNSFST
jgi:iron-sulfur cluster insertion protein